MEKAQLKFKVLTVGDGDLTFSLALKRAYPTISVTASTLLSCSQDLIQTYANSHEVITELEQVWKEKILYGVDATKLNDTLMEAGNEDNKEKVNTNVSSTLSTDDGSRRIDCDDDDDVNNDIIPKFNVIIFNHPHLGDAALHHNEKLHAQRHYSLLCHYFHSAQQFLSHSNEDMGGGRIQVCLCGSQPQTWNVMHAAERNGLVCCQQEKTASPVDKWLFNELNHENGTGSTIEAAPVQSHYKSPRRYRNGKLGSKHFLGKYGYRHRRTGGVLYNGNDTDMMVDQSINFVFRTRQNVQQIELPLSKEIVISSSSLQQTLQCHVCSIEFKYQSDLVSHYQSPAIPDIMKDDNASCSKAYNNKKDHHTISKNSTQIVSFHNQEALHQKQKKLAEATVSSQYDGKRLRWCCRQPNFSLSRVMMSKKHCETLITSGRVYVNNLPALDSSRILKTDDIVTLIGIDEMKSCLPEQLKSHGVKIVNVIPTDEPSIKIVVAYKPVGIRTIGTFSSQTLEMIVTQLMVQRESNQCISCNSISKLDTGCAGLCVLLATTTKADLIWDDLLSDISYTFTALVHGSVPYDWEKGVFVQIPEHCSRQWTKKSSNSNCTDKDTDKGENLSVTISSDPKSHGNWLFIKCQERFSHTDGSQFDASSSTLSTLTIKSNFDSGRLSNLLCFLLRKLGFPVVNDRFCKHELSILPRIMRNILKNKLCVGCFSVDFTIGKGNVDKSKAMNISIEPHSRTLCLYWKELFKLNMNK